MTKLRRGQQRGHVHIRDEDIEAAQQRKAEAQQALTAARQRTQNVLDVLLSLDAVQYPEARYYADTAAGRAPPQHGLGLLHASGLFVDRELDRDYEVGGIASRDQVAELPDAALTASLLPYLPLAPGFVAGERRCTPGVARAPSPRTRSLQVDDARIEGRAPARDSANPARGARLLARLSGRTAVYTAVWPGCLVPARTSLTNPAWCTTVFRS